MSVSTNLNWARPVGIKDSGYEFYHNAKATLFENKKEVTYYIEPSTPGTTACIQHSLPPCCCIGHCCILPGLAKVKVAIMMSFRFGANCHVNFVQRTKAFTEEKTVTVNGIHNLTYTQTGSSLRITVHGDFKHEISPHVSVIEHPKILPFIEKAQKFISEATGKPVGNHTISEANVAMQAPIPQEIMDRNGTNVSAARREVVVAPMPQNFIAVQQAPSSDQNPVERVATTIPLGVSGGVTLQVTTPTGRVAQFVVPAGATPGATLLVEVPADGTVGTAVPQSVDNNSVVGSNQNTNNSITPTAPIDPTPVASSAPAASLNSSNINGDVMDVRIGNGMVPGQIVSIPSATGGKVKFRVPDDAVAGKIMTVVVEH